MELFIIAFLLGMYIFVFFKSFYTKASEIKSIDYFKFANFNAKLILFLSLVILVTVLIIHGGVYWGYTLFTSLFSLLGFLSHVPMEERVETYIEQVAMIIVVVMLPYAKYSYSMVQKFKEVLFDYLLTKYDVEVEIIKNKSFGALNNFVFTNSSFLNEVQQNLRDATLRYSSENKIDDTFYFPEKDIYITECTIETVKERYKVDSKGKGKWKLEKQERVFNGLVVVLPKQKYAPNSAITEATIFEVDNSLISIQTDTERSKKKHNIILELFYKYFFRKNHTVEYSADKFSQGFFHRFNATSVDYGEENQAMSFLAQKLNVDFAMEDQENIYLFHKENDIDLFTLYQNESVDVSVETFENDFQLLLKIYKEIPLSV